MDVSKRTLVMACLGALVAGWLARTAWDSRDVFARQGAAYDRLNAIADNTQSFERMRDLTRYLEELDDSSVLAAVDGFESSFAAFDAYERNYILARIAEIKPNLLMERVRTWEDPDLQKLANFAALKELISRGRHQAAVRYWESLPANFQHLSALVMVSQIVAEGHLDAATRFATSLRLETQQRALDRIAGFVWRTEGASALMAWVAAAPAFKSESDSDKHAIRVIYQSALKKLATHEPEAAADWAVRTRNEPYATDGVKLVATRWTDRDPEAAIAWAAGLELEEGQKQAVAAVLQRWGIRDQPAVARWLKTEEMDPELDPVLFELVRKTLPIAPMTAALWSQRIVRDEDRFEAQRMVARVWLRKHPEAAAEWLRTAGLPEADVEALLKESAAWRRRNPLRQPS